MTTEEFYTALARKTRRERTKWAIVASGDIRTMSTGWSDHCPLSFVAGTRQCDIEMAREKIGLRSATAHAIANAADGVDLVRGTHRSRLLKACGLEG